MYINCIYILYTIRSGDAAVGKVGTMFNLHLEGRSFTASTSSASILEITAASPGRMLWVEWASP